MADPALDAALSDLAAQVAAARAAHRPLTIRGGGTRAFYGEPSRAAHAGQVLDLSAYRGVVDYAPSELVLTARAGTPLADIEALLTAHGQMLAFEPPRFGAADTLGGCIATGLSGPRRMAAGTAADFVLGTRVLDAGGRLLRFGGEVMKNVAGYDIPRLLAGSLGALAALVEVSLKVVPRPRREVTLGLQLGATDALARCVGWRRQPLPISATAWVPDTAGRAGRLHVRLSGNASAVQQALDKIGGEPMAAPQAEALWTSLRDQTHTFFAQRPLWRIALPPKAPVLEIGPMLYEWGGGLRWVGGAQDAAALRARVGALGGSVCAYRRDGVADAVPTFQPLAPAVMKIQRRIKAELDPTGVFDASRLLGAS